MEEVPYHEISFEYLHGPKYISKYSTPFSLSVYMDPNVSISMGFNLRILGALLLELFFCSHWTAVVY